MNVVALTGSGISSASGVPTYRSKGSGWDEYANGIAHATRYGNYLPQLWKHWTHMGRLINSAEPNLAHVALAATGVKIITQNVDGLHQKAGSTEVIELHGNMRTMRCLRCKKTMDCDLSTDSPVCAFCGSARVRTNGVLFGEQLLSRNVKTAMSWINRADIVFSIGNSGSVQPARSLLDLAIEHHEIKTVLFDIAEWPDKPQFSEVVLGLAEETLPVYLWNLWLNNS